MMAQCSTRRTPVLLIAETRPTLASGLKVFLSDFPDTQSVAIMAGFDHVVDYAEQHEIALIIVGEGMNSAAPLGELARLHKRNPSWRLVLLTDVADPDTVLAGLSAGASGVIPTSVGEDELHSAITRIRGGGIYFPDTRGFEDRQHRLSSYHGAHLQVGADPAAAPGARRACPRQFQQADRPDPRHLRFDREHAFECGLPGPRRARPHERRDGLPEHGRGRPRVPLRLGKLTTSIAPGGRLLVRARSFRFRSASRLR